MRHSCCTVEAGTKDADMGCCAIDIPFTSIWLHKKRLMQHSYQYTSGLHDIPSHLDICIITVIQQRVVLQGRVTVLIVAVALATGGPLSLSFTPSTNKQKPPFPDQPPHHGRPRQTYPSPPSLPPSPSLAFSSLPLSHHLHPRSRSSHQFQSFNYIFSLTTFPFPCRTCRIGSPSPNISSLRQI